MASMTSNVYYNNKQYACEFVKNVKVEGEEVKGSFKIYVSRHVSRAFLVDDYNNVIAQCIIYLSRELNAILDDENKYHEKEVEKLCNKFAGIIYLETWDEVKIY